MGNTPGVIDWVRVNCGLTVFPFSNTACYRAAAGTVPSIERKLNDSQKLHCESRR